MFWRAYNGHVLIITFLIGLFAMVLIAVQQNLSKAETSVKTALGVVAFLQPNTSDADAQKLADSLKAQDPEILSVEFTSKEKAYEEAMRDPNLAKSLVLIKSNPLPPSLTIQYSEAVWQNRIQPTEKISPSSAIQEIRWDPQAYALYRSIHRWRVGCMRFSGFIGAMLLIWAIIGLYQMLSANNPGREIWVTLVVGVFGGTLAWGLWAIGLHSIQAEISALRPSWIGLLPVCLGLLAALGCFGFEVRHAD